MKTYSTGEVMCRRTIDGLMADEWVPAEVAQGLYEALREMRDMAERVDSWESFPSAPIERAGEALAAADEEDV